MGDRRAGRTRGAAAVGDGVQHARGLIRVGHPDGRIGALEKAETTTNLRLAPAQHSGQERLGHGVAHAQAGGEGVISTGGRVIAEAKRGVKVAIKRRASREPRIVEPQPAGDGEVHARPPGILDEQAEVRHRIFGKALLEGIARRGLLIIEVFRSPRDKRGNTGEGPTAEVILDELVVVLVLVGVSTELQRIKSAAVISGGFTKGGRKDLQDRMVSMAKEARFPFIGPDCLGVYVPLKVDTFFLPIERMIKPEAGGADFCQSERRHSG